MNVGRLVQNIFLFFLLNWNEWKYLKYVNFIECYVSFRDWLKFFKGFNKKDLVRVGFIYIEIGDRVICFLCGLFFKDWEFFDDFYKEYFCWLKNCVYVNMVLDGKDYYRK